MPNVPKITPQHLLIGQQGEDLAAKLFEEKGFEILHRNFRLGKAEIDLIVQKKNLMVFVEVKTRTNVDFGMPEGEVTRRQAKMIIDAAEQFTYAIDWQHNIRFDIVAIVISKGTTQIEHFEDAFY